MAWIRDNAFALVVTVVFFLSAISMYGVRTGPISGVFGAAILCIGFAGVIGMFICLALGVYSPVAFWLFYLAWCLLAGLIVGFIAQRFWKRERDGKITVVFLFALNSVLGILGFAFLLRTAG